MSKRKIDNLDEAFIDTPSKKSKIETTTTPRKSYNLDFKLKVIEQAKKSTNRETARYFNLDEKQVREWRKNEDKMKDIVSSPSVSQKSKSRKLVEVEK